MTAARNRRASRVCGEPGCPTVVQQPYCSDHARPARQPWEGSTRRATLPRDWNRRVAIVKRRDGNVCQWPTPEGICGQPGRDVDHRVHRDEHDIAALWLLCRDHHNAKTQRESRAGRAAS